MATPPDFTTGAVLTAAQMSAVGSWLITSRTTTGLTHDFDGVFTSDYRNYRVVVTTSANTTATDITMRMRAGGSMVGTGGTAYSTGGWREQWTTSGGIGALYDVGVDSFFVGRLDNTAPLGFMDLDIYNPQNTQMTAFRSTWMDAIFIAQRVGRLSLTTACDGFRLQLSGTWSGTISIYGIND